MGGPMLSGEEKRQEVLNVVTPLAAQLQMHGINLNTWADNFVRNNTQTNTIGAVRSSATNQFITQAIQQNPALADRYIEMRTRGLSATDRQFVNDVTAGTTGTIKTARCEQAVNAITGMNQISATPEERGDIAGMLRAGSSWADARAQVLRDRTEASPQQAVEAPDVFASGLNRINTDYGAMLRLNVAVQNDVRSVGHTIDRPVEAGFGVLAATGTVFSVAGGAVVDAVTLGRYHRTQKALDGANTAGAAMFGDLSTAIENTKQAGRNWDAVFLQYSDAVSTYRRAADNHDLTGMLDAGRRIEELKPRLRDAAARVASTAAQGRRASGEVNEVITSGAVAVLASGAGVGAASVKAVSLTGTQVLGEVGKGTAKSAAVTALTVVKSSGVAAAEIPLQ